MHVMHPMSQFVYAEGVQANTETMMLLKLDYVICHMVSRLTNLVMSWSQS